MDDRARDTKGPLETGGPSVSPDGGTRPRGPRAVRRQYAIPTPIQYEIEAIEACIVGLAALIERLREGT